MKILIADDDVVCRRALSNLLSEWGYGTIECGDGPAAWAALQSEPAFSLAILDWQMPGLTGPEVCRLVRQQMPQRPIHLIVLTAMWMAIEDLVKAFEAGTDDFLTKPFEPRELQVRLRVGRRMVKLQSELAGRLSELETALASVTHLQGLLPICAFCKRVRDDNNYWREVEAYLAEHSAISFSHSLCPDCIRKHYPEHADKILGSVK